MGVVQRLNQFIETKGISKYKFYQKTGLSNGSLDKGDNLGSDKCEKIHYAFPEINLVWLITGQGKMLIDNPPSTPAIQQENDTFLYNMYKEERAKSDAQAEQIGALKQQVKALEKQLEDLGFGETKQQKAYTGATRTRKSGVAGSGSAPFADQSGFVEVK